MSKSSKFTVGKFSRVIVKNIIVILVFAIIGGIGAGLYAKHKKQTFYYANSSVLVNANLNRTDYKNSAVMAEKGMMKTYEKITGNQETMRVAKKYLPHKIRKEYTADQLFSVVNVNSDPDSLVLGISARTDKSEDSVKIANAVAKAAQVQLPKYSPNNSRVQILTRANKENVASRTTPSTKKYAVLGAALGLLIGMILSFSVTTWKNM
ncbi:MAG: YveK family protein [Limosilactobacillus sp.]